MNTDLFPDDVKNPTILRAEDVSGAVLYVIGTPAHVQVHDLMIRPLGEAF